jgi:hypothetical protein
MHIPRGGALPQQFAVDARGMQPNHGQGSPLAKKRRTWGRGPAQNFLDTWGLQKSTLGWNLDVEWHLSSFWGGRGGGPGSGHDEAGCKRVGHFCGAQRRAHAAKAAARARAACVERARRAPLLGSSCSPDFSGSFCGTGGARACEKGMLECGGADMPFWRTSAAAGGGTAQRSGREKFPKSRCLRTTTLHSVA